MHHITWSLIWYLDLVTFEQFLQIKETLDRLCMPSSWTWTHSNNSYWTSWFFYGFLSLFAMVITSRSWFCFSSFEDTLDLLIFAQLNFFFIWVYIFSKSFNIIYTYSIIKSSSRVLTLSFELESQLFLLLSQVWL